MDCLFCLIVQGKIPSYKIFEENDFICILDIYPANPGQVLIIPKKHAMFIWEIEDETLFKMFSFAKLVSLALKNVLKCDGINIYIPMQVGTRVPHFCIFVIPRYEKDDVKIEWTRKQLEDKELKTLQEAIQNFIYSYILKKEEKKQHKEKKDYTKAYYEWKRLREMC